MDDAEVATSLVTEAGTLAARMLAEGLDTHYKTSVSDVVSAADHAAEELVVQRLSELRPADGLVGEEGAARPGDRTWYIDPVDGTYNFLSGLPYWCSAIGLVDADGPVLGAVYYPARDELWVGGRNHPTTLNGKTVAPLTDESLDRVSVATYFHPRHLRDEPRVATWRSAVGAAATVRMLGSASVDLAGVASGRVGVFLQANLSPWDWFPGAALVLGAGGTAEVLELDGNHWQIAGSAQAVRETADALRRAG
ncbi:MAG TPA: inositol monophosphatase family protein [Microlunatus sp.]|nr:inositol monophosphatase family protein [Microlunatus sp.]